MSKHTCGNRNGQISKAITFYGKPVHIYGAPPAVGTQGDDFKLTRLDLSDVYLSEYGEKIKVLNIFPSIDTPFCAMSVRRFNMEATDVKNAVVLNISSDLPFAQERFKALENIQNVELLSSFRSTFAKDWGLEMIDSTFAGLLARTVIVLGPDNKVLYVEQVAEIAQEPNYDAALSSFR